jgi:hypothetical protein
MEQKYYYLVVDMGTGQACPYGIFTTFKHLKQWFAKCDYYLDIVKELRDLEEDDFIHRVEGHKKTKVHKIIVNPKENVMWHMGRIGLDDF